MDARNQPALARVTHYQPGAAQLWRPVGREANLSWSSTNIAHGELYCTHRPLIGAQHNAIGDDVLVALARLACAGEGGTVVQVLQGDVVQPRLRKPHEAHVRGKEGEGKSRVGDLSAWCGQGHTPCNGCMQLIGLSLHCTLLTVRQTHTRARTHVRAHAITQTHARTCPPFPYVADSCPHPLHPTRIGRKGVVLCALVHEPLGASDLQPRGKVDRDDSTPQAVKGRCRGAQLDAVPVAVVKMGAER